MSDLIERTADVLSTAQRAVALPGDIDTDAVKASMVDGVLTVTGTRSAISRRP